MGGEDFWLFDDECTSVWEPCDDGRETVGKIRGKGGITVRR